MTEAQYEQITPDTNTIYPIVEEWLNEYFIKWE